MNFLIRAFLYTLQMHAFSVPDLYWPIILASIKILSFLYLDSSSITFVLYSSSRDSTSCSLLLSNALSFSYMNVYRRKYRGYHNTPDKMQLNLEGACPKLFTATATTAYFWNRKCKTSSTIYRSWFKQEISFRIFNKYSASTTSKLAPIYKLKRWKT